MVRIRWLIIMSILDLVTLLWLCLCILHRKYHTALGQSTLMTYFFASQNDIILNENWRFDFSWLLCALPACKHQQNGSKYNEQNSWWHSNTRHWPLGLSLTTTLCRGFISHCLRTACRRPDNKRGRYRIMVTKYIIVWVCDCFIFEWNYGWYCWRNGTNIHSMLRLGHD